MTGLQSPVHEATQVLGTRESSSAPSGSQAKSSGAVNPQQAARQPDEAMPSEASGWASGQPRRCAGRQAGAHRRGEEPPEMRSTDLYPHWNKRLRFLQGRLRSSTSRALLTDLF
jgi:hypothetical protein